MAANASAGPKLYSYVVSHDTGFAPNPNNEYCTLACCKPDIRRDANIGDWVMGTGSTKNDMSHKLIYAMRITEKLNFVQYSKAVRFKDREDNIYALYENNAWQQRPNPFHRSEQTNHDLSGVYVLISDDFYYFGKKAEDILPEFQKLIKTGPKYKKFDSDKPEHKKLIDDFINWLRKKFPEKGKLGDPIERRKENGNACKSATTACRD